jgi:choline dehydrogenase-like flavoprotein
MTESSVDVVVIGSGAGGGVVAKELGEAGLSVVVLEAGRRFDPARDYPTASPEFELHGRNVFRAEDPRRDRFTWEGAPVRFDRVKGVGGSTLHYLAISPRLHESDFRTRSLDGVGEDWPITYEELEPYYTGVEYELGVSGPHGSEANPFDPPRSLPFPTPPHPFNLATLAVKRGADRLGLHLVRDPVAIPTRDWAGRRGCVGAGTCGLGCSIRSKSSIDVTYVPKAEATGRVEMRTESMAHQITVRPDGRAGGVLYFDAARRERRVHARAVVVAGNAVETARLLLMSTSPLFPDGLANSSGLVGKYFLEHLAVFLKGRFRERLDPWRGIPSGGIIQDFYATRAENGFARGWSTLISSGPVWPLSVAERVGGWGAEHRTRMTELFAHFVGLASVGEQLPDIRNEVVLDPWVKDCYGLPVPRLVNQPRENDQAMIRKISQWQRAILEAAGAEEIWEEKYQPGASSHFMGTCRMGADPSASVVDSWCRAHDVPNLFIGDGSVWVTAGAVNPALTISALAARTAYGIVEAFRRGDL